MSVGLAQVSDRLLLTEDALFVATAVPPFSPSPTRLEGPSVSHPPFTLDLNTLTPAAGALMRAPGYEAQCPALALQRENPSSPDQFWIPKSPPPSGGEEEVEEEEDLFVFNDTIEGPRRQVTRGEPSFRCGSAPPCITIMSRLGPSSCFPARLITIKLFYVTI